MASLEKTVRLLWKLPERECQYCAQDLLEKRCAELTLEQIPLLEFMITTKPWWDTVDFIATKLVGPLLREQYPAAKWKVGEWLDSGNLWLARTTLLFQLRHKQDTNVTLLAKAIKSTARSNQFFIQKAIGWALREYAKTDPAWVLDYVERTALSPLSKKEALKNLRKGAAAEPDAGAESPVVEDDAPTLP
jgi:3-methyladenine DNA glycosylase AlkD